MSIVVAVSDWLPGQWTAPLAAAASHRRIVTADDVGDPAEVRYALAWKPAPGFLASLPNLEVVFSLGAGVDHLLADPALPDVPIVRIVDPDLTGRMTEWVVLQVLMHHRRQRDYDRAQAASRWTPLRQWAARDVRVGIMGLGQLGRDAAEVLLRLGFDVAGWSRNPQDMDGVETFAGEDGLGAFLARTDILVVLLPLTPATRGILSKSLFERLACDGVLGGPVLINAGRGGLQVESELVAALGDGTLKAASLDVFEAEPLPQSSPFWRMANVTVSPHVAADSDPALLARIIVEQIEAYERGEGLKNLVDRASGY
jgi:glyoxylate/hydroxypyruvate reductase A